MESSNPDESGISSSSVVSSLCSGDEESWDLEEDIPCIFDKKTQFDLQNMTLTGREEECTLIGACYRRIQTGDHPSEVILIDGLSGTGKSMLAESLRGPASLNGHGFFVSGKFDQLRNEPYVALVEAFSDICDLVSQDQAACREIAKKLEGDITVLKKLIPNLSTVTGLDPHNDGSATVSTSYQTQANFTHLKLACRRFLTAVASKNHPVVLLLDDLQWADKESIEIIQSIVTDVNSRYVLLAGTFRSNEADSLEGLLDIVQNEAQKCLQCTSIHLDGFGCDQVAALIATCTDCKPGETKELADLVAKRTNGNPLFVMGFLEMLEYNQLLAFDPGSAKWVWSVNRIKEETIACDNVVEIVKSRIKSLKSSAQSVLGLAAVLGFTFEADIIKAAIIARTSTSSPHDVLSVQEVDEALIIAEDRGLIESTTHGSFRFSHDSISDCLYSMTPAGMKLASVHLQLAHVMQRLRDNQKERYTYSIAEQLNRAKLLIDNESDRLDCAQYNLLAAKQALGQSAFDLTWDYAQHGLAIVKASTKWDARNYATVLDLHCIAAEALYCCGNMEESNEHLKQVFENAVSLADTSRARIIHIYALGAHARLEEAIDVAFCGARKLGIKLPRRPRMGHAIWQLMRTKAMLRGKSDAKLLELPEIEEEGIADAAHFVGLAAHFASVSLQVPHLILATVTLMQLLVKGKCARSATFCAFGVLETAMGNIPEAVRMADLASKMHEIQDDKATVAIDSCVMHTFLIHWRARLYDSLEPLQRAYVTAYEDGKNSVAFLAASTRIQLAAMCGYPLEQVERTTREYVGQMYDYQHVSERYISLPFWQFFLNMMGQSDIPTVLSGEAMDEETFIEDAANDKVMLASQTLNAVRIFLACHFELPSHALHKLIVAYEATETPLVGHFMRYHTSFYAGLSYIQLYRSSAKRSHRRKASKIANDLRKLTVDGCPNTRPLWALMNAELATLARKQDPEHVASLFRDAIHEFSVVQNICLEAMANERAARYYQSKSNEEVARQYMGRAATLYEDYGAVAKVNSLQRTSKLLHNNVQLLHPRSIQFLEE